MGPNPYNNLHNGTETKILEQMRLERLKNEIISYTDFPKPGINFRDIFSLMKEPSLFSDLMDILLKRIQRLCPEAQVIVGLESRGFLFGPILALALNIPFVPIRKKGKLPGMLEGVTYTLEYGMDKMEIQKNSIQPDSKVVIIDDLLATGGTMEAASRLIINIGSKVSLCIVCIELETLQGRKKIQHTFDSLIQY